jgi:uncharacterized protein
MKFRTCWMALCAAGVALAASGVVCAENIKQIHPSGYVTDLAQIIQPQTKTQLEALCTELEEKTGAQMAIVTVRSLDGNEVQQYANDLFKQLGIGQKKQDTGVLLLVAPNERKYWTEVGYGLEPIINDARAGDAGRLMVPFFRQGNYSGGIAAASWQLAKYVADDKDVTLSAPPAQPSTRRPSHGDGRVGFWIFALVFFLLLRLLAGAGRGGGGMGTGFLLGALLGSMGGRSRGGWSSGSGGGGWGGGGGGFGGFGGGASGGGGAGGSW